MGNVIGVTDKYGALVEKYSYSAYGAPSFVYDDTPPQLENIYKENDFRFRFSFTEPVTVDTGTSVFTLRHNGIELEGSTDVGEYEKELVFITTSSMVDGEYEILVSGEIVDNAGNVMGQSFTQTFTNTSGQAASIYDNAAPEVESIEKTDNAIVVTLRSV